MKHIILATLFILGFSTIAHADPVMDRINASGKLRCGYVSYAPASVKDPNTGEMKGYTVELVEQMAKRMGVTVEWAVETNWPTMAADLMADKFDLACVTYWSNPKTGRQMLGSDPIFYQPAFFATRADDTRFDKDISKSNDPAVSVSVLEGDVPESILNELYPKAKQVAMPQTAVFSQIFQEVSSKRADVTITSKPDMDEFKANNPGKMKIIMDQPVRLFPTVMQMKPGASQLQSAVNISIREMQLDGTIAGIFKKYATGPDDYYLIDMPYSKIKGVK